MRRAIRSCVALCLVLVAVVVIVGTGFAMWTFANESTNEAKIGVYISETTSLGKFYGTMPSYAVLEEDGGTSVNGTVTGITFYNVGMFYKDGEDTPLDPNEIALYNTTIELKFKTDNAMSKDMADTLNFGIKISLPSGILADYFRMSTWYLNRVKLNDPNTTEEFIDLEALVMQTSQVQQGKSNFEYAQNVDGTWTYTFRFTTTLLSMCFEYANTVTPNNAQAYAHLVERLKSGDDNSNVLLTFWQGSNKETV